MEWSAEDLKTAYLAGRRHQNELTPDILIRLGWTQSKVEQVMSALIKRRLCSLKTNKGSGKVSLLVRDEETAAAVRSLEESEYKVFAAIEAAGCTGIWTRDIAQQTKLASHAVQRAVTSLCDSRKLIKSMKSIHQKNRKIYILASLEPSTEVVGGTFYRDGEFDNQLVERVREQVLHILRNRSQASASDISEFIRSTGLGTALSNEDLELVLRTLELEQQITRSLNPKGETTFMWSRWSEDDIIGSTPCASCPIAQSCLRDVTGLNPICPQQCQYLNYWLGYPTAYKNSPEEEKN